MELMAVFGTIVLLVLLIAWLKIHPFLAFLVASTAGGIALGLPLEKIPSSLQTGIGNTLGGLAVIICLGAMFGRLVAESGAAQKISQVLMAAFGRKYLTWALMFTGFIVGIPLFYNVGFVLLVPLVFAIVYQYKLPAVYLGIPLLAALSVTHGFLPPHPSPTAIVPMFNANLGLTLIYGLIIAVPVMILAGPVLASYLKGIHCEPIKTFAASERKQSDLPSALNCFVTALLPVVLIAGLTVLTRVLPQDSAMKPLLLLVGNPMVVMLLALAISTYSLGLGRGMKMSALSDMYSAAIKDVAVILLIVAGAGTLKQVFVDSGVSQDIGALLQGIQLNPLITAWFIATVIRICLGSATVAGLTAAGIVAPLAALPDVNPNLLVLSIGAGSLMCSHVNDSGFWMYKEYFNLSLKDTFRSWTLMETVVGITGLLGVLILDVMI